MRYIRFLKPPRVVDGNCTFLLTITSDLGEDFLYDDVVLSATLRSNDVEGDIYLRKTLKWTAGTRTLAGNFNLSQIDVEFPARVHVGVRASPTSDHFEVHQHNVDPPSIISAWSAVIHPDEGITEAEKRVERRFTPLSNRTISIWEETGESIARHLWDAGVALCAYLDRMIALQAEALPLLEEVLSTATYKRLRVLELGSGCGIVGIGLSQIIPDTDILLTDQAEAEEIANLNIRNANTAMGSNVAFQTLNWEEPLPKSIENRYFHLIMVADCTYNPDSSPDLVRTISAVVGRSPKAIVVVSMKIRHPSEMVFFELMEGAGFVIGSKTVLTLPVDSNADTREKVDVYVFQHKERPRFVSSGSYAEGPPVVSFWQEED